VPAARAHPNVLGAFWQSVVDLDPSCGGIFFCRRSLRRPLRSRGECPSAPDVLPALLCLPRGGCFRVCGGGQAKDLGSARRCCACGVFSRSGWAHGHAGLLGREQPGAGERDGGAAADRGAGRGGAESGLGGGGRRCRGAPAHSGDNRSEALQARGVLAERAPQVAEVLRDQHGAGHCLRGRGRGALRRGAEAGDAGDGGRDDAARRIFVRLWWRRGHGHGPSLSGARGGKDEGRIGMLCRAFQLSHAHVAPRVCCLARHRALRL